MRNRVLGLIAAIGIVLGASGCNVNPAPRLALPADEATPVATEVSVPTAEPLAALSLAETEALVKSDLALRLDVAAERLQVTEAVTQTWADATLGCGERRGVFEVAPVPGYQITLAYGDEPFRYHTDQQGRYVRCQEVGKPLGPIIDGRKP